MAVGFAFKLKVKRMRGFLRDCCRIEELAGLIYQRLAGESAYAPEVRTLFNRLAGEELDHARQFDLLLQGTAPEIEGGKRISWERVDTALQLAEEMLASLDSRRLEEEEALRLAVRMEQEFIRVHVHNAVHFHNPRLAALFEELGRQDEAHLDRLRQVLTWWHSQRRQR